LFFHLIFFLYSLHFHIVKIIILGNLSDIVLKVNKTVVAALRSCTNCKSMTSKNRILFSFSEKVSNADC